MEIPVALSVTEDDNCGVSEQLYSVQLQFGFHLAATYLLYVSNCSMGSNAIFPQIKFQNSVLEQIHIFKEQNIYVCLL